MTDQITFAEYNEQQTRSINIVIDCGQDWSNGRSHCCDLTYRNDRYIQTTIRKWGLTQREAYQAAVEAWLSEKAEGRAQ